MVLVLVALIELPLCIGTRPKGGSLPSSHRPSDNAGAGGTGGGREPIRPPLSDQGPPMEFPAGSRKPKFHSLWHGEGETTFVWHRLGCFLWQDGTEVHKVQQQLCNNSNDYDRHCHFEAARRHLP